MDAEGKGLRRYDSSEFWDTWYTKQSDAQVEWSSQVNKDVMDRIQTELAKIPEAEEGKKRTVMELGCGSSNFACELADLGFDVVGVDFSQEVITANRLRYPKLRWECADALRLGEVFQEGEFDCIIGKTLLDCFMAGKHVADSIRTLLEQCHKVLKESGRIIFLDKTSAYHHIGRGRQEKIPVAPSRSMHLHVLCRAAKPCDASPSASSAALPPSPAGAALPPGAELGAKRLELDLPALGKHLVTRNCPGSTTLTVWTAEGPAAEAGLESGDRILGFDARDGKGVQMRTPGDLARALKRGALRVVVERGRAAAPRGTGPGPAGAAVAHHPSSPESSTGESRSSRVSSRRSSSQTKHLQRQLRARMLLSGSLPSVKKSRSVVVPKISEYVPAGKSLFM